MAQLVNNPPAMWGPGFDPWVGKIPWRRERLPTPVFWPREFLGVAKSRSTFTFTAIEDISLPAKNEKSIWLFPVICTRVLNLRVCYVSDQMNCGAWGKL